MRKRSKRAPSATHCRTGLAVGRAGAGAACVVLAVTAAAPAGAATSVGQGPSSPVAPYVLPVADETSVTSLLTVGSGAATDGTRMVGIPDGLGSFTLGPYAVVLSNQELRDSQGIVREHGQKGAFVSRWLINRQTLEVERGGDLIKTVRYWDYPAGTFAAAPVAPAGATTGHTAAFSRFCSGYLAPLGSLLNLSTLRGYGLPLYLANEESGDEGRLFGVTMDGVAYQLPRTGLFSWENTLVAPTRNDTSMLIGNEDAAAGQLWIYRGTKQRTGNPVERAGLNNGNLFVVDTADETVTNDVQFRATYGKGTPAPVTFGSGEQIDWNTTGAAQNAEAAAKGLTLNRIEDGAFDPRRPNDYYFLTTEGGDRTPDPAEPTTSRDGGGLWRLTFKDVNRPDLGATLTLLLDGSEAPYLNKPDNMTIDRAGNLLIQEDPGGNDHLARIVAYRISDGRRGIVARFDPALFGVTNPAGATPADRAVLTTDEESSGIIPTDAEFGKGTFLFDAQVHTAKNLPAGTGPGTAEELVENGQYLLLTVGSWTSVYGG